MFGTKKIVVILCVFNPTYKSTRLHRKENHIIQLFKIPTKILGIKEALKLFPLGFASPLSATPSTDGFASPLSATPSTDDGRGILVPPLQLIV